MPICFCSNQGINGLERPFDMDRLLRFLGATYKPVSFHHDGAGAGERKSHSTDYKAPLPGHRTPFQSLRRFHRTRSSEPDSFLLGLDRPQLLKARRWDFSAPRT